MKKFGEKLRVLRQQKELSLQELSDMLDVSITHVWNMEHGQKMPNATMILKIADIFGVCADKLMRDELEVN